VSKQKKPLATLTCFFVISASLKLHFARRYYEKTRRLPGFFCFVWSRRDWLRPAFLHAQAAAILWVGCQNKEAVRYAHLFFRYISLAEVALRSALLRKNPAIAGLLLFCVESEGFEPSSRDGTAYAFYMLSIRFIVGKGKAGRSPIPFSLVAVSRRVAATPNRPVPWFDAPDAALRNQALAGQKLS
jgi:hypothetical protein